MARSLAETDFAVIDLETTGLFPQKHDRVIEIAVVRLSRGGRVSEEYVTLVNPGRDLGPTHVHGITAQDILAAPLFADIVGDVLQRLTDAVVVAHNVQFDKGFLIAECTRCGIDLPDFPSLCTLRLSNVLSECSAGRALPDCCSRFGVELDNHHSAADDARACALLLARCLERAVGRGIESLEDLIGTGARFPSKWPKVASSGKPLRRCEAARLREIQPNYLATLVSRLMSAQPQRELNPGMLSYLELLDRALEDRLVSELEAEALFEVAREFGLTGEQVVTIHRTYLDDLARAALADGTVTAVEEQDLLTVAKLLGFDRQTLMSALENAKSQPIDRTLAHSDLAGKSVCFTGSLISSIDGERIERSRAEQLAANAGLIVAKSVTKSLDILVVADPLTLSGKAKKARDYGTRIIAEMAFWRAIGVNVD